MNKSARRIELLDELRGFAILAMIVHHFFLDVGDVLSLDWGYTVFDALCKVQPLFWAIFIVISGICSRLSRNTIKRGIIVFASGMLITLITAVVMPLMGIENEQIYFGILHCLGCCMIITGVIMPIIEKTPAITGIIVSATLFFATYGIGEYAKQGKFPEVCYKKHSRVLSFVGKNSLWFYLGHQAVLYAILYFVILLIKLYVLIQMK